jgi:hypothetical protein
MKAFGMVAEAMSPPHQRGLWRDIEENVTDLLVVQSYYRIERS